MTLLLTRWTDVSEIFRAHLTPLKWFGLVTQSPGPSGSGLDPQKGGLLPNLFPLGVLGQVGRVAPFRNRDDEAKTLGALFWFCAHGPRKRGWKAGLAGESNKIFGISIFFMKGTPAKIWPWSHLVLCNFLIPRTPRAPVITPGPGRVKIKSQNWGFYGRDSPHPQILKAFCFIQLFDSTQPRGPTGPSKSSKRVAFPGLQLEIWGSCTKHEL